MKIKTEFLVLGTIILAATAYLLFHKSGQEHYQLPDLPKIDTAEVTRIDIEQGGRTTSLEKKDDRWLVQPGGFPADGAKVKGMLFTLEDLTLTALVSESGAYARYDLSQGKRIAVRAAGGEKLLRAFDIGKEAPTFQHTFVTLPGDDRVYHARGDFRKKFDRTVDDLRDKIVMSFIPEKITAIEIATKDFNLTLKKPGAHAASTDGDENKPVTWEADNGKAVDPKAVDTFMEKLNRMECQKFLADRSPSDLKKPELDVVLVGDERIRLSVYPGKAPAQATRPGTSSQTPYVFSLAAWQVKNLTDIIMQWKGEGAKKKPAGASAT